MSGDLFTRVVCPECNNEDRGLGALPCSHCSSGHIYTKVQAATHPENDAASLWAYNLGIKLDRWIPLFGMDNFQRIESAVKQFIELKKATPPGFEMVPEGTMAEEMAKAFHSAYEGLAPSHGYETRIDSRTAWKNVPQNQKALMIETCSAVLRWLHHRAAQKDKETT